MSETTTQQPHRLRIWNDPESRIAFLETVLKGKDWEAVVYEPPKGTPAAADASKSLEEIQKELGRRDYSTKLGKDDEGNRTLTIKHFGTERGLVTNVQELGLVKGWNRTLDHLPETFSHTVNQGKDAFNYVTGDKARLLSGLYLAGDALMILASAKDKSGVQKPFLERMKDPEQYLHTIGAMHALGQSLFLMKFAKDGSEIHLDALRQHMDDALQHGVAPSDVLKYKQENEQSSDNFVTKFAKRHPLEIASAMQISGGAFMLGSSAAQLKKTADPDVAKAIKIGMGGTLASMTGWAMLMAPTASEKDGDNPNLFQRHQEEFASGAQLMANGLRMYAAGIEPKSVKDANAAAVANGGKPPSATNKNPWTVASEGTFMLGDLTMMALDAKEYGAHGAGNPEMTAKAAATFISSMPMVLGQEEEQKFIGDLSNYLARQIVEEQMNNKKSNVAGMELTEDEQVKALSSDIGKATRKELMGKERKLGVIVNAAANLAHSFPDDEQPKVIDSLSQAISQMAGVYVQKDKLRELIDAEERTLVMIDEGGGNRISERPKMNDVAKHISSIVMALPPLNAAENASYIYDSLTPMMETTPRDGIYLEQAMKDGIAQKQGAASARVALNTNAMAQTVAH